MKLLLLFLVSLSLGTRAQPCSCEQDSFLSELISCTPIVFDNHAQLFWNYSCDSSWLTFEDTAGKRNVIYAMELVEYTGRLGYSYAAEYGPAFLIRHTVISGCCDPPMFYLYDKASGNKLLDLDRILFYSEERTLPFIVGLVGSGYEDHSSPDYNTLFIYHADSRRRYTVSLPAGQIARSMKDNDALYPELLFDAPQLQGSILTLTWYTGKGKKQEHRKQIDLAQYSQ